MQNKLPTFSSDIGLYKESRNSGNILAKKCATCIVVLVVVVVVVVPRTSTSVS